MKKVRVRNTTTDGTSVRVFVDHINPTIRAVFDVQPGSQQQNNHMSEGHRGVIVYDDFQDTVILTDEFKLEAAGPNVLVTIVGSAVAGYSLAKAAF